MDRGGRKSERTLLQVTAEESQVWIGKVCLECDMDDFAGNEIVLACGARVDEVVDG